MVEILREEEHAALFHERNDLRIRFKDRETREVFYFRRELARVINRAIDFEAVLPSQHKVVVTMTGRGVYATCAGFAGRGFLARVFHVEFSLRVGLAAESHMFAQHQKRWAIDPRMP